MIMPRPSLLSHSLCMMNKSGLYITVVPQQRQLFPEKPDRQQVEYFPIRVAPKQATRRMDLTLLTDMYSNGCKTLR